MYLKWCVSGQNGMIWETSGAEKPTRNVTTTEPWRRLVEALQGVSMKFETSGIGFALSVEDYATFLMKGRLWKE